MDAFAQPQDRNATIGLPRLLGAGSRSGGHLLPSLFWAFHAVVGTQAATPSPFAFVGATLILAVAFVVPFLALALARHPTLIEGRGGSPMPAWRPQRSMSSLASFRP